MAAQPEVSEGPSTSRPVTGTNCPFPDMFSDASGDDYIEVTCGALEGKLYFNMMKDCTGSQLGSVKCIVHNDSCLTPGEFEQKGGKPKAKN